MYRIISKKVATTGAPRIAASVKNLNHCYETDVKTQRTDRAKPISVKSKNSCRARRPVPIVNVPPIRANFNETQNPTNSPSEINNRLCDSLLDTLKISPPSLVPPPESNASTGNDRKRAENNANDSNDKEPEPTSDWLYGSWVPPFTIGASTALLHGTLKNYWHRDTDDDDGDASKQPLCVYQQIGKVTLAQPGLYGHSVHPVTYKRRNVSVQTDVQEEASDGEEMLVGQVRRALITGESKMHNRVGRDLVRKGLLDEAFSYFRRAAIKELPSALYNLGLCYWKGYGTGKDMNRAVELWLRAAADGHPESSYQVGVCYLRGLGLEKDTGLGHQLIEEAGRQGVPEAQFYMGVSFLKRGQIELAVSMIEQAIRNTDRSFFGRALLSQWRKNDLLPEKLKITMSEQELMQKPKTTKSQPPAVKFADAKGKFWVSDSDSSSTLNDNDQHNSEVAGSSESVVFEPSRGNQAPTGCGTTMHRSSTVHDFRTHTYDPLIFSNHPTTNFVACET